MSFSSRAIHRQVYLTLKAAGPFAFFIGSPQCLLGHLTALLCFCQRQFLLLLGRALLPRSTGLLVQLAPVVECRAGLGRMPGQLPKDAPVLELKEESALEASSC